jgi:[acyl-carrier-protein] S-malonyltransferase
MRTPSIASSSPRNIAFLFPGQGSQTVAMGRELRDQSPAARAVFEEADDALGFSISKLCFEGPEDHLKLTENTQPAILTVSVAAARVLAQHEISCAFAAGHSLGEYSAYVTAGTLSFADAVRTVRNRGRYMQDAVPAGQGAMAAILGLTAETVAEICAATARETGGIVAPANINSPEQTVISGAVPAVEHSAALCKERGAKRTVMLPVSAPFHCALMQPAQDRLAADLKKTSFHDPDFPVVCNVDAAWTTQADAARDGLIRQVTGTVRWVECEQRLIAAGATHFVEVGPGRVLWGLLRQLDRNQPCYNVENAVSLEKTLAALQEASGGNAK